MAIAIVSAVLAALVAALMLSFVVDADDEGNGEVLTLDPNADPTAPPVTAGIGDPAPAFSFEPLRGGEEVDFATFRAGRPALINFFRRTCVPCVTEMPDLEDAYQDHRDDIAFLGISFQESVEDGRALVTRTGVTYQTGRDPRGDILAAFEGIGLPTTVLVAADGTIATVHTGTLSREEIEEELDQLA